RAPLYSEQQPANRRTRDMVTFAQQQAALEVLLMALRSVERVAERVAQPLDAGFPPVAQKRLLNQVAGLPDQHGGPLRAGPRQVEQQHIRAGRDAAVVTQRYRQQIALL